MSTEKTETLRPTNPATLVRDPGTAIPLNPNGDKKTLNTYWRRRIRDKDVEIVNARAKPKTITKN